MELLAKILNDWKPIATFPKSFNLEVGRILNTPLRLLFLVLSTKMLKVCLSDLNANVFNTHMSKF